MPSKNNKYFTETSFLEFCEQRGLDANEALDELVHETFSEMASDVNNQGVEGQLDFLKEQNFLRKDIEDHFNG